MNPKQKMFHAIEQTINDITKIQDVVIKLTREIHELHVAPEHESKRTSMKEYVDTLKTRMDVMQEFLYSCEHPTEHKERRLSEIDVVL